MPIDEHTDRATVLAIMRETPCLLAFANAALKDDYEVVLVAVQHGEAVFAFKHASERLRADPTIAATCITNDNYNECIKYVAPSLLADRAFVLSVLDRRPYVFLHSTVPHSRDFLLACVAEHATIFSFLPDEYAHDKQFVLDTQTCVLQYLAKDLQDDRDVVLAQVRLYGEDIKYASPRLQRDRALLIEAVRSMPYVVVNIRLYMEYADSERDTFLSDEAIVIPALDQSGYLIRYVSHTLRTKREIVMIALTAACPASLGCIPASLASDPCISLCAADERPAGTVAALLTVLEANVADMMAGGKASVSAANIYAYTIGHPFKAETILALLLKEPHKYTFETSTDLLDALATAVNEVPAECVQWVGNELITTLIDNNDILTDAGVEEVLTYIRENSSPYGNLAPNHWERYGKCDAMKERLQRLAEIDEALPYISKAVRRAVSDDKKRTALTARVAALAAKVHAPTGVYARLVHKRAYAEAFA